MPTTVRKLSLRDLLNPSYIIKATRSSYTIPRETSNTSTSGCKQCLHVICKYLRGLSLEISHYLNNATVQKTKCLFAPISRTWNSRLSQKPSSWINTWLSTSVHSPVCNIPTRERNAHDNMPEGSHFKKMILLPCVCPVIDHRWRQNVVPTKTWHKSDIRVCRHLLITFFASSVIFYWTAIRQHGIQLLEKTKKNVYDVILIDHS